MYIVQNSYAEKILIALCYSGEFSYNSLNMLDKNKVMLQRNARKLESESYIGISGKGKDRTMRLKQKGRDVIKERYPALYNHYVIMTDDGVVRTGKANQTYIWRAHRLAEMMLLLQKAGVYFLDKHKPPIDNESMDDAVLLPENSGFFYTSKEMKGVDEIARYKVSFTRILGMIVTSSNQYALYNTNEGLIKWNNQGENKAQKMMDDLINKSFIYDERVYVDSAILFARDMSVAYKVLTSKRGKKDFRGFEFLSFDNTFPNMYFLTLDDYGVFQIQMLMLDNWKYKLNSILFSEKERESKSANFDSDAIDTENKIIKVEFISGNIGKIKRAAMAYNFNRGYKFKIYALPYQVEFLSEFLPNEFEIEVVNIGDLYRKLFT